MQSDTIIGIAGAVVLVAVMVGVFAYEYNNAPDEPGDDGSTDEQDQKELFNATYPTLDPDEDIDWDGTANWQDGDMDDDGIDNQNDTDRVVDKDFDGTVGQRTPADDPPPQETYTFHIGTGMRGGTVTVTWEVTQGPAGGPIDNLDVSIEGDEAMSCDVGNGEATCELDSLGAGEYRVVVGHAQSAAQAKDFSGNVNIVY